MNIYDLLNEIALNSADEQEAISGYTKLWNVARKLYDNKVISGDAFQEIHRVVEIAISEEMKHAKLLADLYCRISDIKPEE